MVESDLQLHETLWLRRTQPPHKPMSWRGRAPLRKRRDALSLPILLCGKGMQFPTPGMLDPQHQHNSAFKPETGRGEACTARTGGMAFFMVVAGTAAWPLTALPSLGGLQPTGCKLASIPLSLLLPSGTVWPAVLQGGEIASHPLYLSTAVSN